MSLSFADRMKQGNQRELEIKTKQDQAIAAFTLKHQCGPEEYIKKARGAAYAKVSTAGGSVGRSQAGIRHTAGPRAAEHDMTPDAVTKYHDMEEAGKAQAAAGNLQQAAESLEKAAQQRLAYEAKGHAADEGHARAVVFLRERSRSISRIVTNIETGDRDLVAAKAEVIACFKFFGVAPPFII